MTDLDLEQTREAGEILRRAREEADLSRPKLAPKVGTHPNRLQQIEQGYIHRPGAGLRPTRGDRDTLLALCEVLGISHSLVDRILTLSGYKPLDPGREIVYLRGISAENAARLQEMAEKYRREDSSG